MRAFASRWIGLILLAAIGVAGCETTTKDLGGPAKVPGKKRMVFLINTPDAYWEANDQGLKQGAKLYNLEAAGLSIEQDSNTKKAEGQIEKLRQYATQDDIVAVGISPWDANNLAIVEEMRKLKGKGIHVITVDNDVNVEKYADARSFYLGTDNHMAGQALGTGLNAVLAAKGSTSGNYAQFVGNRESDNARARMDGVSEKIGAEYKEVSREADGGDTKVAADNVRNILLNHKDVVALVGIWAYNAPAIAGVVDETKNTGKIAVGTFDAQEGAIKAMGEKQIDVMLVQNPFDMGVQTVRLLKAMVEKDEAAIKEMYPRLGEPGGDVYTTGVRVVVPDESSPVKKEMFDPKSVEFMTLEQFRNWLAEYGLKSS